MFRLIIGKSQIWHLGYFSTSLVLTPQIRLHPIVQARDRTETLGFMVGISGGV